MLFDKNVNHQPLLPNLKGAPFVADLSPRNTDLLTMDVRDPERFQRYLDRLRGERSWGFGDYLENRATLLRDYPQMVADKRFFHLGIDLIVPGGTVLHAPLASTVAEAGHEPGAGNYGGFVLLAHAGASYETFYSLYGHLEKATLPEPGRRLRAGEAFAATGDFDENGGWFHHTHLQVITAQGLAQGYLHKGYCRGTDRDRIASLCPSPLALFRR